MNFTQAPLTNLAGAKVTRPNVEYQTNGCRELVRHLIGVRPINWQLFLYCKASRCRRTQVSGHYRHIVPTNLGKVQAWVPLNTRVCLPHPIRLTKPILLRLQSRVQSLISKDNTQRVAPPRGVFRIFPTWFVSGDLSVHGLLKSNTFDLWQTGRFTLCLSGLNRVQTICE